MIDVEISGIDTNARAQALETIKALTEWNDTESEEFISSIENGHPLTLEVPDELAEEFISKCHLVGIDAHSVDGCLNKFVPDVASSEIQTLSREKTMDVLKQVESIANEVESYANEITVLTEKIKEETKKAENIRNDITGKAMLISFLIVVIPVALGMLTDNYLGLGIIISIANCFVAKILVINKDRKEHEAENIAKSNQYILDHVEPLQGQLDNIVYQKESLETSGKIEWAIDVVGKNMFQSKRVAYLHELIKSRRADNLKEALNKFDDVVHQRQMEKMQRAIQESSEVAAKESIKQTEAARITAAASIQNAANSKAIYRETKRIRRKL